MKNKKIDVLALQQEKCQLLKRVNDIMNIQEQAKGEKYIPEFKEKYEGTFYKFRNSYGLNEKGWNLYYAVTSLDDIHIYTDRIEPICSGWSFQCTSDGRIEIQAEKSIFCGKLEKKITPKEFYDAYNKMIKRIDDIDKVN